MTWRIAHVDSETLRSRRSRRFVRISGHEESSAISIDPIGSLSANSRLLLRSP